MGVVNTVTICGKPFSVSELTMQDIHDLAEFDRTGGLAVDGIALLLEKSCGVKREAIMPYRPSDLQPLIDMMLKVNAAFFAQAAALQTETAAKILRSKILGLFMLACLPSSVPGTPAPGDTP